METTGESTPLKDWKTWLTVLVVVLTALLQAFNGSQIEDVKKKVERNTQKVERNIERSEKAEEQLAEIKAAVARPVVVGKQ